MNKELMLETLKDGLAQLGLANDHIAELTAKDKVAAHIEMAKAYALTSIAVALSGGQQAPETVAETKKQKGASKKAGKQESAPEVPEAPPVEEEIAPVEVVEEVPAPTEEPVTGTDDVPLENLAQEPEEAQLVSIVEDFWIQFNRPVIENDFDYSAWLMEFVNVEGVGAPWANDYMTAFTGGQCTSIEDLNDDNAMAYINFVIDAVNAANQQ